MRPAAVLSELPTCSRRASAGLLRSHPCQPGRSGRLARVMSATAPPGSPTTSSSTSQSTMPVDAAAQARPGAGQVTAQQPNLLAQKSSAAAAPPQSHAAPEMPSGASNSLPTVAAACEPAAPPSPSGPAAQGQDPALSSSWPSQQHSAAGPAPSAGAPQLGAAVPAVAAYPTPPLASPPLQQALSDGRSAVPANTGKAEPAAALDGTPLPTPSASPAPAPAAVAGSGSGGGSAAALTRHPTTPPAAPPTGKLNGSAAAKGPAAGGASSAGGAAESTPPPSSPSSSKQPVAPAAATGAAAATSSAAAPGQPATPASGPSAPSSPAASTSQTGPATSSPSGASSGAAAPGIAVALPTTGSPSAVPQSAAAPGSAAAPPASSTSPPAAAANPSAQLSSAGGAASVAPWAPSPPSFPPGPPAPASAPPPAPTTNATAPPPTAAGLPPSLTSTAAPAAAAAVTAATPGSPSAAAAASSPGPTAAPPSPSSTGAAPPAAQPTPAAAAAPAPAAPISSASSGFQLRPIHVVVFAAIFLGGALFAALTVQFTQELEFQAAAERVWMRVSRSDAFRQLWVIAGAIFAVRFGLNNVLRALASFSANPVQWDKSKVYYILKEVYQPLELLLFIAAICAIAESIVPQLIAVPRSTVHTVVRSTLSVSFIIGAATVVFNLKSRFCKENAWQSEMNGDVTAQRRWEAYDKLGTFVIYTITFVLGIQALGLEVTSVLAIGGIGGLAIGLAGREICENILNGFLIMSTSPFEVGDEVHFFHSNKVVEGMVLDIGWYRTTIRSYEREVFVIPNAVFSKNIVLNITRKNREWRFFEHICVRVQDVHKVNAIIQDIRRIVRNDQRIITKLHRRIFLDKLTHEDCRIYVSFYVEAQNRESFMAAKQDLLLAFVDCVERNGAKLAVPRTTVQMEPEVVEALSPMLGAAAAMAAAKVTMDVQQAAGNAAAAAARALTDGRTITAEVTAVPTMSSPTTVTATAVSGGTTATSGRAAGATTVVVSTPGSPSGKGSGGGSGAGGGGGGVTADSTAVTGGGAGAAAAASSPSAQGQSKGSGSGLTWLLSKLAQVLFET